MRFQPDEPHLAAYTVGTGGSITRTWPINDPLGSVAAQVNSANVATQINRYDEYGEPQAGFSGRFGYAGAMFLERGMAAPWHMRNRQYNPTLGRFMQTDPIGYQGGMNLYAYVGGDPVNRVDPWGLQDNPGDVDALCVEVAGCMQRYWWAGGAVRWRVDGGYGGTVYQNHPMEEPVVLPEVVVTGSLCDTESDDRQEQFLRGLGYLGDGLFVVGAFTANPGLIALGAAVSLTSEAVGVWLDWCRGDRKGLTARGVGVLVGAIPGARWVRRGRAVLDPGRNAAGRYVGNWNGRRATLDRTAGSIQGGVGSATFAAACSN